MSSVSVEYFTNLAIFLKTPLGQITNNDNVFVRTNKTKTTRGIINIIFSLLKDSNSNLRPSNNLDEAQIRQWLEYIVLYLGNGNNGHYLHSVLKDLNGHLQTKTYLVNEQFTIADALLYYVLLKIMTNLSNLDKERYMHVSRWFDNIQQDSSLRQSYNLIDFSTNYLVALVPSKH